MTQTFDEFLSKYLDEQDEKVRTEYEKAKKELRTEYEKNKRKTQNT